MTRNLSFTKRVCHSGPDQPARRMLGEIQKNFYHYITNNRALSLITTGNIANGLDNSVKASIYTINNMKMLPAKCRECPTGLREKCHICMATNKSVNGDYYTVADDYCLMMKELNSLLSAREIKDKIDKIGKSRNWLERKIPKRERGVPLSPK